MAMQPEKCDKTLTRLRHVRRVLKEALEALTGEPVPPATLQEQEWRRTLHELSDRLQQLLSGSDSPSREMVRLQGLAGRSTGTGSIESPSDVPIRFPSCHLITTQDGVIQTANADACHVLGLDRAHLGRVSLRELISREEWKSIKEALCAGADPTSPKTWMVTVRTGKEPGQPIQTTVLPLFDGEGRVSHWVWEVRPDTEKLNPTSFTHLNERLMSRLVAGESLESCLSKICEGLVSTFGVSCTWMAVSKENGGMTLLAHAEKHGLDWAIHGMSWWKTVSQIPLVEYLPSGGEVFHAADARNPSCDRTTEWVPGAFQSQECLVMPLIDGGKPCGVFVVASDKTGFFDQQVCTWLQLLRSQVMDLIGCGNRLAHMRLQSAIMDSVSYGVCVTDAQGCIQWVNEVYAALVGVPIPKILGTVLPTFPCEQVHALEKTRSHGLLPPGCVKTEVQEVRPTGEKVTCEQTITPLVNQQGTVTHYVAVLQDITGHKSSEAQMKYLAYHDPLTDLPNRFMFRDRLQQALAQTRRQGGLLAVLFLDLDNFKPINDRFGHQVGDRLLRVVAKRLVTCVRSTDTVARLSGDEFTVILQGFDRIRDIRQVTQKILHCLTPPIRLNGRSISVKISIGIAVYPKDSTHPQQLLELADHAMYRAKEQGGQRWVFATDEWNME
jgi:diguanylate cyclase (GGDEF)-like protein/PAS domain S-box-containing protein